MLKYRMPAWSTGLRPAHKNMGEGVQTSNWIYTVCATRLYLLYQIASQWLAYVILLCYTISNVVLSKNFLSIQRIVSRNIAIT